MKKLFVLVAALLMVGSAFAQSGGQLFVQPNATFATGSPATTDNDDSCDIGVTPAATLLLPHFEVGTTGDSTVDQNTLFTITNVSAMPAIAHVVVWTDWSYPVLDFNIYLTGYDVQPVSLWNVLVRGEVPITDITPESNSYSPRGVLSDPNVTGNPNFDQTGDDSVSTLCNDLPGEIPPTLLEEVQDALLGDIYYLPGTPAIGCSSDPVGGEHDNYVGYVTVDVASTCTVQLPTNPDYFSDYILFDNQLIGDYQRINPTIDTGNYAGGNPMVHIRAIPEGGPAGASAVVTNLPYTFYDRYVPSALFDRRQPLPGLWAARYIDAEDIPEIGFGTQYAIWREGNLDAVGDCGDLEDGNGSIEVVDIVRFDEHENPFAIPTDICLISPCQGEEEFGPQFPETSNYSVSNATHFPADPTDTDDVGGWMYLNLNHDVEEASAARSGGPFDDNAQAWVVVQMTAESRYGVDFDAAWLGNGCTPDPGDVEFSATEGYDEGSAIIGPAANATPVNE